MHAPRVFASIVCVLIAFAVASYIMTGSIWTVVIQTVISAVILQVGYFIGILLLVRREKRIAEGSTAPDAAAQRPVSPRGLGDSAAEKAASLIGARGFHPNSSEKS